jgi:HD-GYP domain-containing protein (c-di-GMP phosphodiesterase class II)
LTKAGKLTDAEWSGIKRHVRYGHRMIQEIAFLRDAAQIVLHHHERYDGTGYPGGVARDDIVMGARIFAVADTFDAMTSERPYRKALPYDQVKTEIVRCSGTQFDPRVVETFLAIPKERWGELRRSVDDALAARRS